MIFGKIDKTARDASRPLVDKVDAVSGSNEFLSSRYLACCLTVRKDCWRGRCRFGIYTGAEYGSEKAAADDMTNFMVRLHTKALKCELSCKDQVSSCWYCEVVFCRCSLISVQSKKLIVRASPSNVNPAADRSIAI